MIQSIFISSAGDLKELRQILSDDLRKWLSDNGFAHLLRPYRWEEDLEYGRLLSNRCGVQSQMPDPAADDVPLTICLFGERCGSPLQDDFIPQVNRRFDSWRAEGDRPGLLHPWPHSPEEQQRALDRGQYPLTGTVYELISAHTHPEDANNLIVACCVAPEVKAETPADKVIFNGRKLHARLTAGQSSSETRRIEAEVYDPQTQALLNLFKHHARKVIFVPSYPDEETMRRDVFSIAQHKLREKLGIASLRNPFKQSLEHWTVHDEKPLPGRGEDIQKIIEAMNRQGDFVLLKGRSGCGKSSLMQRGVMRRLREIDGSIPIPFRPTELMAASGDGDALDRVARLIADAASVSFATGGPKATRPNYYAQRLLASIGSKSIVIGLDQFEEIIDELKIEREQDVGNTPTGWWLVLRFLRILCAAPSVRLIATLESARETSFRDLGLGEAIDVQPNTLSVDATADTVAEIARNGFSSGGLPLEPAVLEEIKRQWTLFEKDTPSANASPLPLACLFLHRLYERFADRAGVMADGRLDTTFRQAGDANEDRLLTLKEVGGRDAISFANIIQNLADEAWRAAGKVPYFTDPIQEDSGFVGLNNFLKPFVIVNSRGLIQLRAVAADDADASTRKVRRSFEKSRLLVPVLGDGLAKLKPVHQALFDHWSPAVRWLAYRKEQLRDVQVFRETALFYANQGKTMPVDKDGSTLRAAAMTLEENFLGWRTVRSGFLGSEDKIVHDLAIALFEQADNPSCVLENSIMSNTYAHLASNYHLVGLLERFIKVDKNCLKSENKVGDNLLHKAAWSSGPAVNFLLERGVPLNSSQSKWNAITPAIQEHLNDNFYALVSHIDLDDVVETEREVRMVHWAARYGNMTVIEYLKNHKCTLNIRDRFGWTALHYAAFSDQAGSFDSLLQHIRIEEEATDGSTGLSLAAMFGSATVVSTYLNRELNVNRMTTLLHHKNKAGHTPTMIATAMRHPDALRILIQPDLGESGDPSSDIHRHENGDTLFHIAFRNTAEERPTDAERFNARAIVEILLRDGRLDPNVKNEQGETAFDIAAAFPEARRVLREDPRVPTDYAQMTPAMRIEDLSNPRASSVLRLLKEAPQALTDAHGPTSELPFGVRPPHSANPIKKTEDANAETGLDILVRLKNYVVLTCLVDDPVHWPALQSFEKLAPVAVLPDAKSLRAALLRRVTDAEVGAEDASELLRVCIDANDTQAARELVKLGVPLSLRRDEQGYTVLHRAAIASDTERFRTVLSLGTCPMPFDNWGRRPSDLAADTLVTVFQELESAMIQPERGREVRAVAPSIVGTPPFLSFERAGEARPVSDVERAILEQGWDDEWGDIATFDIRVFDQSFNSKVQLIEVRPKSSLAASGRLCFLLTGKKIHHLNGTSPPIHEVNAEHKPSINQETVLFYLAFFCFFVRGNEGPFLIIDRPENFFLPNLGEETDEFGNAFRRPKVWCMDENGNWLVTALVFYSNALFLADFSVQATGMIEMVNDTPLHTDLPGKVDARLEIRLLH